MSRESPFYTMPAAEAVAKIDVDPASVVWPIVDFMTQFGLAWFEVHPELMAGRLVANGRREDNTFVEIHITAQAYLDWIAHPKTPSHLVEKVHRTIMGPMQ